MFELKKLIKPLRDKDISDIQAFEKLIKAEEDGYEVHKKKR